MRTEPNQSSSSGLKRTAPRTGSCHSGVVGEESSRNRRLNQLIMHLRPFALRTKNLDRLRQVTTVAWHKPVDCPFAATALTQPNIAGSLRLGLWRTDAKCGPRAGQIRHSYPVDS